MKKTVFSLLLIAVLLLSLGAAASAETAGGAQKGDILYFGQWDGAPLRWIILDPDATNAGTNGVFLLSEQTLTNQGVVYAWARAVWQGGEGQAWCTNFAKEHFSALEKAAVPAVSKSEEAFRGYGLSWGATTLEEEQVFFISAQELADYIGPNDGDPGLSATYIGNGKTTYYWLRTPHGTHVDYAGLVVEDNNVHDFLVYGSWGARPATNVGGENFLYLTPNDGKLGARALGAMPTSESGEWKAVVVDPSLTLSVEKTKYSDGVLTVRFANAPQGAWISVLGRDAEGRNVSYACLGRTDGTTGEVSFTPTAPEGGTLFLFAEFDKGEKGTNVGSALCPLSWVEETPEPVVTPEPTPESSEGGTISLVETESAPEPTAAPEAAPTALGDYSFRDFLRETKMFAIPFAALLAVAIAVSIVKAAKAAKRRSKWDDDDYTDEW